MKNTKWTLYFIVLLAATACKKNNIEGNLILQGQALEIKTNKPIEGAEITAYTGGTFPSTNIIATVTTDKNGYFSMEIKASDKNAVQLDINNIGDYNVARFEKNGITLHPMDLGTIDTDDVLNLILVPPAYLLLDFNATGMSPPFNYARLVGNRSDTVIGQLYLDAAKFNFMIDGNVKDTTQVYLIRSLINSDGSVRDSVVASEYFEVEVDAQDTLFHQILY